MIRARSRCVSGQVHGLADLDGLELERNVGSGQHTQCGVGDLGSDPVTSGERDPHRVVSGCHGARQPFRIRWSVRVGLTSVGASEVVGSADLGFADQHDAVMLVEELADAGDDRFGAIHRHNADQQ